MPNSFIDVNNPGGVVDSRYFRGSGTSRGDGDRRGSGRAPPAEVPVPDTRPGQALLPRSGEGAVRRGADQRARRAPAGANALAHPVECNSKLHELDRFGSLELSRGSDHITDDGVVLTGEQDIFGHAFDGVTSTSASAASSTATAGRATPGPATAGAATPGRATAGAATPGPATAGRATAGPATPGRATAGRATAGAATAGRATAGAAAAGRPAIGAEEPRLIGR